MRILVTGATGYIGGRLVPRLLDEGHDVSIVVRDPARITGRKWSKDVTIYQGDLLDTGTLEKPLQNCDAVYYLVHSMYGGKDFKLMDRTAARNFLWAWEKNPSKPHIIYLGGLVPQSQELSQHLSSRAEVGEILRESDACTEFRAGPIIGSGSASFEMVRYLTERLPVMVAPRWILNDVQPIAVRDILFYLIAALDKGPMGILEVGTEALTFRQMMQLYAHVRGLKRMIIPVPVLAPKLAALWVGLVTPMSNSLAVPLIEGIVHPVVVQSDRIKNFFPDYQPLSYEDAVRKAFENIESNTVETRWSGSLGGANTFDLTDREGIIRETRTLHVDCPPNAVYKSFSRIGGERGWLAWEWAWKLRGLMDTLVGGPGLRRGRRHSKELFPGEALDFWRVEKVVPDQFLRLRAEMKVPGKAWLQWESIKENGGTRLVQTALFAPTGFWGVVYWYSLYPFHGFIFSDLIQAIARDACNLFDKKSE